MPSAGTHFRQARSAVRRNNSAVRYLQLGHIPLAVCVWMFAIGEAGYVLAQDQQKSQLVNSCIKQTVGDPPSKNGMSPGLARAMSFFDIEVIEKALAACRAAIAIHPEHKRLKSAHRTAVRAISVVFFGLNFKGSESEGVERALKAMPTAEGLALRLGAFYLGSAFEYGRGTGLNLVQARRWYAKAAAAGSKSARQRLTRIRN